MINKLKNKRVIISFIVFIFIICTITFVFTYSSLNTPVIKENDPNASRISGNIVYINELESDYYYYMGYNYTYHENLGYHGDHNMPSGNNQNIYKDSNLVQVELTYKGEDFNGNKGYVSLNELQDTFVYKKIYNITDNYVNIELISNPFTNRPNNMGFNGWVTTDSNITITKDANYDIYYARIPVTYTNGVADKIEITFNASWASANIGYIGGTKTWDSAFSNLKEEVMVLNQDSNLNSNSIMAGFYKGIKLNQGENFNNLYNTNGNLVQNGNCNDSNGCIYYEYLNYHDSENNINYYDSNYEYYYLNTKDTNIIVMNENTDTAWTSNKPFTLTSIHNGVDYRSQALFDVSNISIICNNDTVIENIKISSNKENNTNLPSSSNNANATLYGRWNNVKLGRGIIRNGNYSTFENIIAGYNENIGANYSSKKHKIIIESGFYNNISLSMGASDNLQYTNYLETKATYGNDYDKAAKNDTNLDIYYSASGSYGGTISPTYEKKKLFQTVVKSGTFGSSKLDTKTGIFVGGTNSGTQDCYKDIKVEGGYIYNLIGDDIVSSSRIDYIDVYMYITGGRIEMVVGGSTSTSTYGHRIIQMTGGTIGYSILGASNYFSNNKGALSGNTFIYIGGNSIVGDSTYISSNKTLYGIESGSVFGAGNGQILNTEAITESNTYIIVADEAIINNGVYGGSNNNEILTGDTNIKILGGEINNIFGAGNLENSYVNSNILINVNGGIINSVYGGTVAGVVNSDDKTTLSNYKTTVNINSGTVNNVYGGSKGGKNLEPHNLGVINVNINGGNVTNVFGANDLSGVPSNEVNVYLNGGEISNAYGGGNSTDIDETNIELNGANIGNLYGGSNDTGTAKITNVTVTKGNAVSIHGGNDYGGFTEVSNINIDGGVITNVYGGGRFASTGITNVSLNKTTITNAYGGGENADVTVSANVKLNGSNVTNLYGGSDHSGDVKESNITLVAGTVDNIFGGNNKGGITHTSNVDVSGSTMQTIYGGGNEAYTETSNVIVRGSNNKMKNVYGGSKSANVDNSSVKIYGGMFENVYGGSHLGGTVQTSSVIVNKTVETKQDVFLNITLNAQDTTWQTTEYKTIVYVTIDFVNNTNIPIQTYNGTLVAPGSVLFRNYTSTELTENNGTYTFTEINRYYGTNPIPANGKIRIEFEIFTNEDKENFVLDNMFGASDIEGNKYNSSSLSIPKIDNIYGGNNQGGNTISSSVEINDGLISYVYGGGNNAETTNSNVVVQGGEIYDDVYGGGNNASTLGNTSVDLYNVHVGGNIYGGGNAGSVQGDTAIYVHNSNIGLSVYAGGNGETASVIGSTKLDIDGETIIEKSVFGGGNAASTGYIGSDSSSSFVNIAGATIKGNLYGGANTSVLYGTTNLNIGYALVDKKLEKGNIYIGGTVFGGGEANANGDEIYDYSFISVTKGININIDASENEKLDIIGSIFGSGNASSTSGYSYINIKNYGTKEDIKKNISVQRTSILTIDNSYIELIGATDRTNEYSNILYSLSRIDELKLKNNSILYLKNGANLLKEYSSLIDINGVEVKSKVTINEDGSYEKNVDNKLYLYEKTNLNISLNEQATIYGEVNGMSFLGMYKYDEDGNMIMGLYDPKYNSGDLVPNKDLYAFNDGVYVLGKHLTNHDIKIDGFYTNKQDLETFETINYEYVDVTPKDANYYMWVVGELVMEYEFDLTASKYSTLGTYELPLINSSAANTIFKVLAFEYDNLNDDFSLIKSSEVPRISTTNEADKKMALNMKTSNTGWITVGDTDFITNEESIIGTNTFLSENSNVVPSLLFSLYHSKNITTTSDLGTVKITMLTMTPLDEVNNKIERINIIINLKTALFGTNDYEGAMTQGEEYEMFTPTEVDITSNSKLSAYYSLYIKKEQSIYKTGYHRVLLSSFVLPKDTKITMVDLNESKKQYYYYVITDEDIERANEEYETYGEVSYDFSKFIKMGSSSINNNYSDEQGNNSYYDSSNGYAHEEFIFILDFKESNINEDKFNNTLLVELRDNNDNTLYSVLGVQHANLTYNLYSNKDAVIELEAKLDTDKLYIGNINTLTVDTNFVQQNTDSAMIYDTNFFNQKLGIKISIYDENDNILTGTDLLGLYLEYNNNEYYPRVDGTIRINIAERVANVSSKIIINTEKANIASGTYKLKIESFGSADGIYYGLESSDTVILPITIIDTMFGLNVSLPKDSVIINKVTGKGLNDNNALVFNVKYSSGLSNPNLTLSLYRRDYSTLNSNNYIKVDLLDYIANDLKEKNELEYVISNDPFEEQNLFIYMKENLVTGTYKFVFTLYDNNTYIGDMYQYVIIK